MRRFALLLLSLAFGLCALGVSPPASAQNLIKRPRAHTPYTTELEPHLSFGGHHGLFGGPGIRATWPVADPAFIPKLNNSVGIGVGADFYFDADYCHSHGGNRHCHETELSIPIVMQWNFWFTKHWSAFGEPGVVLGLRPHNDLGLNIAVGGRYQINDGIALTLRLGLPVASFGVSFLL
jgi:hypothetical protein